jgi:hypothetical protein
MDLSYNLIGFPSQLQQKIYFVIGQNPSESNVGEGCLYPLNALKWTDNLRREDSPWQ